MLTWTSFITTTQSSNKKIKGRSVQSLFWMFIFDVDPSGQSRCLRRLARLGPVGPISGQAFSMLDVCRPAQEVQVK